MSAHLYRDIDQPAVNPLAQVGGLVLLCLPVFLSFDLWTPFIALGLALPTLVWCLRPRLSSWFPLFWPLLLVSLGAGVTNLLFAVPHREQPIVWWSWGFFQVTDYSFQRALAISGRTLVLTTLTTLSAVAMSPLALVRALMQNLRLAPRWGFALFAGLNLLPGLMEDLRTLKHARLLRLAGRRQSLGDALSLPIFLLAGAIRRAERVSVSMSVRELESGAKRTFLTKSPWRLTDSLYLVLCASCAAGALVLSFIGGFFKFDLG